MEMTTNLEDKEKATKHCHIYNRMIFLQDVNGLT